MFGDPEKKGSFFERLKEGLSKTRQSLVRNVDQALFGEKKIGADLFEELEEMLVTADVGPAFAAELIDEMKEIAKRSELGSPDVLRTILRDNIRFILKQREAPLDIPRDGLYTVMVVGVNGTGKTTTIGKIANELKSRGHSVMLAAADTFRAAAIEQLEAWGERAGIPVIKQKMGADPSAVVFDALQAARAREAGVLLIDTAGRLHTKVNLMEELKKVGRIMGREVPGAPHEVLLVLDATTGQNAVNQARMFNDAIGVTGLVLTKLDGTAKGGIIIRHRGGTGRARALCGHGREGRRLRRVRPARLRGCHPGHVVALGSKSRPAGRGHRDHRHRNQRGQGNQEEGGATAHPLNGEAHAEGADEQADGGRTGQQGQPGAD